MMGPWLFYGTIGIIVFGANLWGIYRGMRDGSISISFEEDSPETRAALRWTYWQLFVTAVSSGVIWPLVVPIMLRGLALAAAGGAPRWSLKQTKSPFRALDRERSNKVLVELGKWRDSYPARLGDPDVTRALLSAACQEGQGALQGWSAKSRRSELLAQLGAALDDEDAWNAKEVS